MKMCPDCAKAYNEWLDYNPRDPFRWIQYPDPTGSKSRDIYRAHANSTYDLIRAQRALIKSICLEGRCPTNKILENQ